LGKREEKNERMKGMKEREGKYLIHTSACSTGREGVQLRIGALLQATPFFVQWEKIGKRKERRRRRKGREENT
jgi:hypothetical protein